MKNQEARLLELSEEIRNAAESGVDTMWNTLKRISDEEGFYVISLITAASERAYWRDITSLPGWFRMRQNIEKSIRRARRRAAREGRYSVEWEMGLCIELYQRFQRMSSPLVHGCLYDYSRWGF